MSAFLKHIEVDNFKSYKGKLLIGPLKSFTAVVGPNGSGKSNLMDAINFVMGENRNGLRVNEWPELIHGASIGAPVAKSTSVTAVFTSKDGTENSFMRSIEGSTLTHHINDKEVGKQVYTDELMHLGINMRARNFLVLQGDIESLAEKKPMEITSIFEELSNSRALKGKYDRLKKTELLATEKAHSLQQEKKLIAAKAKGAEADKENTLSIKLLNEEYAEKQVLLKLFSLFHIEKDIERHGLSEKQVQQEVLLIEKKKLKAEEQLKSKKKKAGELGRDLEEMTLKVCETEADINAKRLLFIKVKEDESHMLKKVESVRKNLAQARTVDEAHMKIISELEDELRQVQEAKTIYETSIAIGSQPQDIQLEEEQVTEYNTLKKEAGQRSAQFQLHLDSIIREQKSIQDTLDNKIRERSDLEDKLKREGCICDEVRRRYREVEKFIVVSEDVLQELKERRADLKSNIEESEVKGRHLENELESVVMQHADISATKEESSRLKRKSDVLQRLQQLLPGVYGRMINLCRPIHGRYNVALTKVLGRNMEAIVVDTKITAMRCIQYLKEQHLDVETFLPLDYIKVKPLKERLRALNEPKGVKLLYDVLIFESKEIYRAVLFITNNILVCETSEDANKAAYDMGDGIRYDCVALDGTFYHKSGLISGGSSDLAKKAHRWNEERLLQLKNKRVTLKKEIIDLRKNSLLLSELDTLNKKIDGCEMRLKYAKNDLETTKKEISNREQKLEQLQDQLKQVTDATARIEETMAQKQQEVQNEEKRINSVEDDMFARFCRQLGIDNIRCYEETQLRAYQKKAIKKQEFNNQIDRIENQLKYEMEHDSKSIILQRQNALEAAEEKLKLVCVKKAKVQAKIESLEKTKQMQSDFNIKKTEIERLERDIGKARSEVGSVSKELISLQRQLVLTQRNLENRKDERHEILMRCKMEGIALPLLQDNVSESTSATIENSTSSPLNSVQLYERDSRIIVDYTLLPDHLKEIGQDFEDTVDKMNEDLKRVMSKIQEKPPANTKTDEIIAMTKLQMKKKNQMFQASRKNARLAKKQFERVKKKRYDKFMACFEHVSNEIDSIYKSITNSESAQACLMPMNLEEPYLAGIDYSCIAPGKRFQQMSDLSGGEKTLAAVAFLFAINSFRQSPFLVLDEIDAALDSVNDLKLAEFLYRKSSSVQIIMISLKDDSPFYAESVIGICPNDGPCCQSTVISLDLSAYSAKL